MLLAVLCTLAGLAAAPAATMEVTLDRDRVSVVRGDRFTVESRITNRGTETSTPLMAHLNVASLTGDVSVDPEDWSTDPIRDLAPLAPGESVSMSWEIKAGDAGSFGLYVVLLPGGPGDTAVVGRPMHVEAVGRNTLDAGGTLPLVVAIPVLLGAAATTARWRARRVR